MPISKSAKKSLRVSQRRRKENLLITENYKQLLKKFSKAKEADKAKLLSQAFSAVDKAAKKEVIAKNKAARIKSQLSKLYLQPSSSKTSMAVKPKTKTTKKKKTKK